MNDFLNSVSTLVPLSQVHRIENMKTELFSTFSDEEASKIAIDDDLERGSLRAYASRHRAMCIQELHHHYNNDYDANVIMYVLTNTYQMNDLFLHHINVVPEYDAVWPDLLNYIAEYARAAGFKRLVTKGKSCWQTMPVVRKHLHDAGFVMQGDPDCYPDFVLEL